MTLSAQIEILIAKRDKHPKRSDRYRELHGQICALRHQILARGRNA